MLMLVSSEGFESWRALVHQKQNLISEYSCGCSYPEDTVSDDLASENLDPGKHLAPRSPQENKTVKTIVAPFSNENMCSAQS
jgi:hypothetical protein